MVRTTQRGLSLVELLVALSIASFLALAATQLMVDTKISFLFQRAQADNQGTARYTLQWLDRQLARTGFKRRPDQPLQAAFPALSEAQSGVAGCAFAAGQVIKPLTSKALCMRYQPSDRLEVDCLGNGRPANASSLAQPYAEPVEAYIEKLAVNNSQQLLCTSKGGSATLIEGIADVRFDYGVGVYGHPDPTTYTASPASDAPIRSVRYAALLSTPAPARTTTRNSPAWRYWHETPPPNSAQGQLHQVIKGTTALRNLLP